jgi:hypothetical protein
METLASIKSNITALQEYARQIIGIYKLGFHFGYNSAHEPDHTRRELYKIYCHRKTSSEIVKQRRWKPFQQKRQQQLEEIKLITTDFYENGGRKPHHDFASRFWNSPEYKEKYKGIPRAEIRKTVGEVADKFGCKIGVRKARKS